MTLADWFLLYMALVSTVALGWRVWWWHKGWDD